MCSIRRLGASHGVCMLHVRTGLSRDLLSIHANECLKPQTFVFTAREKSRHSLPIHASLARTHARLPFFVVQPRLQQVGSISPSC